MIYIDYWTEEKPPKNIDHISVYWNDLDCDYSGNIWDDKHEPVGSYCADTFQDIKDKFSFLFERQG